MKDQDYIRASHEVIMTVFALLSHFGKKGSQDCIDFLHMFVYDRKKAGIAEKILH